MPNTETQTGHVSPHRAVILTALRVEYDAVRAHLTDLHDEQHPQGDIYEQGVFKAEACTWHVGIVEVGEGNPSAAQKTERAITYFGPQVVLFVGVAGGIKDVEIGDVVAATKVYGYHAGKAEADFKTRPEVGLPTHRMTEHARAEARKSDWLKRLSVPPKRAPRVFLGPIAAGEQVVTSKESGTYQLIRASYNDAVAVEMEGYGFLKATHAYSNLEALVVRGISDLIEGKAEADKGGSQEMASRYAAAFAFQVLSKLRLPDAALPATESTKEVRREVVLPAASEPKRSPLSPRPFFEARLVINRQDNAYTARWVESDGQEGHAFTLVLPLTAADTSDLRWYLETYYQFPGAGDIARAQGIEHKMEGWGRAMFDAVFGTPESREVYRNLMDADPPRLLTLGATDADVLAQPWEMMRDSRGPIAFRSVIIRRQLKGSRKPPQFDLRLPLRVLLIVSRPTDAGFIDPRNSMALLLDALEALPGQVELDFCDPPTLPRLEQMISDARKANQPYHIVHFDGHGTYLPLTGVGALCFEDADARTHLVAGPDLGDLLARLDIPLVVLEACRTASLSDQPVFGSVAPALLQGGVGSVVAFSHAVHVQAAKLLVERFYRELSAGRTVGQSLEEARVALRAEPKRWLHLGPNAATIDLQDWFIPQLYQVGDDLVLIAPKTISAPKQTTRLRLSVDLEIEAFDERMQGLLKYGLAGFLKISADSVQIATVEQGSVIATIELPAASARQLLMAHRQNDPALAKYLAAFPSASIGEEPAKRERIFANFPPPPLYRFHGRAMELLELERAFRRHPAIVLTGMGGMGKTALAREAAAWWLRAGRFDAAVFCTFEFKAGAERVVQLLGQALEGDRFSARSSEDQWKTAVDVFHRQRVLLVWDNFESVLPAFQTPIPGPSPAGQTAPTGEGVGGWGEARAQLVQLYRELTQPEHGLPAGRLLVTCRPAETGLPGIKEIPLSGLKRPDSLYLLSAVLDLKGITTDGAGYEREAIDKLLDALDDHPLSIELVAPHLKTLTPAGIVRDYAKLLERFADDKAYEGRNKSLLASLEFSRQRLSQAAQAALPYLAWFEGGVFEAFLLAFAELKPEAWSPIRDELTATALIHVEELQEFNTPYIRFHPTLSYAARQALPSPASGRGAGGEGLEDRFIAVYLQVAQLADNALRGRQPAAGMALMTREEANLRSAMTRAFARGARQEGAAIANTLQLYLERAGRLGERDALTRWVHAQMPAGGKLDVAACGAILNHAWTLFTQGHADDAIRQVQDLIARLEAEGLAEGQDAAFQIALAHFTLGKLLVEAHRSDLALAPMQRATVLFDQLPGESARNNLSVALGGLANSYMALGQFDQALQASERGLAIDREMGRDREVAVDLGRIAAILTGQQRYAEADARYDEAMQATRTAGDLELQGALLQHKAGLQQRQGHNDRAVELYQQAITLFQRATNLVGEMQTCDLLASAELLRGQLDAAEAWYARGRELALKLKDRYQLAVIAQNVGILYQTRAEQAADPAARAAFLRRAIASVKEGLEINLEMQNQVGAASSYFQLGILHLMLGELDQAERYSLQGLQVHESLNLPDVYKVYGNLANIARARGDAQAAAQWQAKRDAKLEELKKLRRGDKETGRQGDLEQLARAVLALAQAAYQARGSGGGLPLDAAEALAQLEQQAPPPLRDVAPFLRAVAGGQPVPPVPPGLPPQLTEILQQLVKAVDGLDSGKPDEDEEEQGEGHGIALDELVSLVVAGCKGDKQAGQQAYDIASAMQESDDPQTAALGKALQRLLEGLRGADVLDGLPAEIAPVVAALEDRL